MKLLSALTAVLRHELIDRNPAGSAVELPSGRRPKGRVWTAERVRQRHERFQRDLAELGPQLTPATLVKAWRASSRPSPVMVWTAEQTARFLQHAATHRLYPPTTSSPSAGLRRGEAVGAKWEYADLESGLLEVATEFLQIGQDVYEDTPKSEAGERTVALDSLSGRVLIAHQPRQRIELDAINDPHVRYDLMFTGIDGQALEPDRISDEFYRPPPNAACPRSASTIWDTGPPRSPEPAVPVPDGDA